MTKFAFAVSVLLTVAAAQECATNVSEAFIATIDNSSYFDTCAEDASFTVTSVFDVLNFTASDFLSFCNSSVCLDPVHELMAPLDCLITYEGTSRNLSNEISELHDLCHEVRDKAKGSTDMSMSMSMSGMDAGSSSSSAASVIMTASVLSVALLAAILG